MKRVSHYAVAAAIGGVLSLATPFVALAASSIMIVNPTPTPVSPLLQGGTDQNTVLNNAVGGSAVNTAAGQSGGTTGSPIIAMPKTTPASASSQSLTSSCPSATATFRCIVQSSLTIMGYAIPIIFSLALVVFLWGIVKYIVPAGDETSIAEGRTMMIYGLIGLAVMVAVWGLVGLVTKTFLGI
jgi:Type IV secretion system pilin